MDKIGGIIESIKALIRDGEIDELRAKKAIAYLLPKASKSDPNSNTKLVWDSYADAFKKTYHTDPVDGPVVRKQILDLMKRVPVVDLMDIVQFYITQKDAMYMYHPINLLQRDFQKICVKWKTGIQLSNKDASAIEKREHVKNSLNRFWDKKYGPR